MNLNFKGKKVFCSFNDFSNVEFINFINKLSETNDVTIYTKNKFINNFFNKNIKIIISKIKIPFLYKLLHFFSKNKASSLNKYYNIENILLKNNIFIKILFLIRLILNFFNLPISKDILRDYFYKDKANILNFDILLTDFRFNEIYSNHEIIYFAKKNNKPIVSILFSWDNLFSNDVNLKGDHYFVGSNKMREILHKRHKISLSKIYIFCSFQFLYILKKTKVKKKKNYILYSCSIEEDSAMANEEIEIINHIGQFLIDNNSDLKVYVRPYPFFEKKINLKDKFKYPNIYVKNYGKIHIRRIVKNKTMFMRYEKNLDNKIKLLSEAVCHINLLSTVGVESVLLKTNTIFLNLEKKFNLFEFTCYFKSNFFKSKFLDHFKIFEKQNLFIKDYDNLNTTLLKIIKKKKYIITSKNFIFFKSFYINQK